VYNHHVEELILGRRRIPVHEIASKSSVSVESVEPIIHECLFFKKVSAWWVAKMLSFAQTVQSIAMSAEHLRQFELEGKTFLE
jgi:hypothetical protein